MADDLLTIRNLRVSIPTDEGVARVLYGVDLRVPRGKVVGVAGESGCGKSTLIRAILRTLPRQARIDSGSIVLDGESLLELAPIDMERRIRGRALGFIPQDPYLALNPVFKVGTQLLEVLRWHGIPGESTGERDTRGRRARHRAHLVKLLRAVQLPDAEIALERYPHQFSGGQRQRLLIAAALACQPKLILADEPTTALDVTTQLQILKLLKSLVDDYSVTMLLVSHDFGVLAQLCDSLSVMYAGQTAEAGMSQQLIEAPRHPYTRLLLQCHPDRSNDLQGIPGQVPSALSLPGGCHFHPRCPERRSQCPSRPPPVVRDDECEHAVACWLHAGESP